MTDDGRGPAPTTKGRDVHNILSRFWTFDRLIGGALVKIIYYIGLVGIALWLLIALVGALGAARYSAGAGLGGILIALVAALFGVVFWRVTCELWLIIFQINDRLGEIRDRLPPR